MTKICKVEGCNEPTFKHFAYCHEHQREQWSEDKKRQPKPSHETIQRQIEANQQKVCIVDGCNEPRYKKYARCQHHRAEQNRQQNKKTYERKKREGISTYNADYYANQTPEEKEARRKYMREYKRKQRAKERAQRDGIQTAEQTGEKREKSRDLADFPRLLVIDEATHQYVEYAPIKRVNARTRRSFNATVNILSTRPNWLVARKDTDDV